MINIFDQQLQQQLSIISIQQIKLAYKSGNNMSYNLKSSINQLKPSKLKRPNMLDKSILRSQPSVQVNHTQSIKRYNVTWQDTTSTLTVQSQKSNIERKNDFSQFSKQLSIHSRLEERTVQINDIFNECFNEDFNRSTKPIGKNGYSYQNQQIVNHGEVQIIQSSLIPEIVQNKYNQKLYENQVMNFNQGFFPQIGFIYYIVQNQLFFFDCQNVSIQSLPSQVDNKPYNYDEKQQNPLYYIQLLEISKPFYKQKKSVMIFIHQFKAQIYEYEIQTNHDYSGQRKINIKRKKNSSTFHLPLARPNRLSVDKKGAIYCTDDNGNLFKIDEKYSYSKQTLSINKFKQVISITSQSIVNISVKNTYNSIKKYAKNLFKDKKKSPCQIIIDENQKIALVLSKKIIIIQKNNPNKNQIQQYLKVYNLQSLKLLYIISQTQLQNKNIKQEIVSCIKIQGKLNNSYNFAFLLESGKRVYAHITKNSFVKHHKTQRLPIQDKQQKNKNKNISVNINSFIFQPRFLAILAKTTRRKLIMTKQTYQHRQDTLNVNLFEKDNIQDERASEYYLYNRKNNYIGANKKSLIEAQSNMVSTSHMYTLSQQVFYKPLQIIYTNDIQIQKIRLLRPIDVFITIFLKFKDSFTLFSKSMQIIMSYITKQQIISFCCQIYTDTQGIYYESRQLIDKLQSEKHSYVSKNKLKDDMFLKNKPILQITYKQIQRQQYKQRLISLINNISKQEGNKIQQPNKLIIKGIFKYYCKILRCLWSKSINDISSQFAKKSIQYLSDMSKLLKCIEQYNNKYEYNNSILQLTTKWINQLIQLLQLISNITKLPEIKLYQAMNKPPEYYHQYIFKFLIHEAKPSITQQIHKIIPIYANNAFNKAIKIYYQIEYKTQVEEILKICKHHKELPLYLINHIANVMKIPQINIMLTKKIEYPQISQFKLQQKIQLTIYQQIQRLQVKQLDIYHKETQMFKLQSKLNEQYKASLITRDLYSQTKQKINDVKCRLKLQHHIFQLYQKQICLKDNNSSVFSKITSIYFNNKQNYQNHQKKISLTHQLYKIDELFQIIQELDNHYLKILYLYYYKHSEYMNELKKFLEKQTKECQDFDDYSFKRKRQLQFFNRDLSKQDLSNVLQVYVYQIINSFIKIYSGRIIQVLQKCDLFWFYHHCADICINLDQLYKIGSRMITLLQDNEHYAYNVLSCYYYIKKFVPSRRQQFKERLRIHTENDDQLINAVHSIILS